MASAKRFGMAKFETDLASWLTDEGGPALPPVAQSARGVTP
jgi:hypothetical protein